eukprot:4899967-Amphidinium_carterae.1
MARPTYLRRVWLELLLQLLQVVPLPVRTPVVKMSACMPPEMKVFWPFTTCAEEGIVNLVRTDPLPPTDHTDYHKIHSVESSYVRLVLQFMASNAHASAGSLLAACSDYNVV